MIDDSLGFTISVYGWLLPEDYEIYTTNLRSICNITVCDLIRNINSLHICLSEEPFELSGNIVHNLIPKSIDPLFIDSDSDVNSFPHKELVVVQFYLNMVNSVQVVTRIHIDLNSFTRLNRRNWRWSMLPHQKLICTKPAHIFRILFRRTSSDQNHKKLPLQFWTWKIHSVRFFEKNFTLLVLVICCKLLS